MESSVALGDFVPPIGTNRILLVASLCWGNCSQRKLSLNGLSCYVIRLLVTFIASSLSPRWNWSTYVFHSLCDLYGAHLSRIILYHIHPVLHPTPTWLPLNFPYSLRYIMFSLTCGLLPLPEILLFPLCLWLNISSGIRLYLTSSKKPSGKPLD